MLPIALFLLCLACLPALNTLSAVLASEPWKLFDEGIIAYAAHRVSSGQLPHLDFPYYYGGLFEVLLGGVFRFAGSSLATARMVLAGIMGLTCIILLRILAGAGIPAATRILAALAGTLIPFGLHFHIFPAWTAGMLVLAAVPLTLRGFLDGKKLSYVAAGLVLGLATCVKQNIGILGLQGVLLSLLVLSGRPAGSWKRIMRIALSVGVVLILLSLLGITAPRSGMADLIVLLTGPLLACGLALHVLWRSEHTRGTRPPILEQMTFRAVMLAAVGFSAGLFAGSLPFVLRGGMEDFLRESFLDVRGVAMHRSILFLEPHEQSLLAFSALGRVAAFLSPPVLGAAGLFLAYRRIRGTPRDAHAATLVVMSIILLFAFVSLYPLALKMYLVYLLPLMAGEAALLIPLLWTRGTGVPDHSGYRRFPGHVVTGLCAAGVLSLAWVTFHRSGEVMSLPSQRLGIPLHVTTARDIGPVLEVLEPLGPDTRFVAYHRYNLLMAFLLGRPTEEQFGQQHMQGWITRDGTAGFLNRLRRSGIEAAVVSRSAVMTLPGGLDSLDRFLPNHRRILTTDDAVVYRAPAGP